VPSDKRGIPGATVAGAVAVLGAGLLAGCATTQQTAARLRLNSARILASQNGTRVTAAGDAVAVTGIALIASDRRTAVVVTVRNPAGRPVSDLPISVGYRTGHRRLVYLNAGSNLTYFDAHLPAVAARSTLTWVYAAGRRLPRGARPFALVGATAAVPGSAVASPPVIRTGSPASTGGGVVTVAVRNLSGVPQYQLPVYVVAERGGRPVAAGEHTLPTLNGNADQTVRLRLLGDPGRVGRGRVVVEAPPTIFH
jgi:hypothetical protein